MSRPLAELFIDITMRGGAKAQLVTLRDQIKAMDKSLANNASLYRRQTDAKLAQLDKIAARQKQIAALDEKTYGSSRYQKYATNRAGSDFGLQMADSAKAAATERATHATFLKNYGTRRQQESVIRDIQKDKNTKQRDELLLLQRTTLERGKGVAIMQLLKNRFASGNTAAMGGSAGGSALGAVAMAAGAAGPAAVVVAIIAAAVASAIYIGIRLARSASPVADATYEGSWKMLTNEIGMVLIPALMKFSQIIQGAAEAVRRFKDSPTFRATERVAAGATSARDFIFGVGNAFFAAAGGRTAPGVDPRGGGMFTSSQHQSRFMSFEEAGRMLQEQAASGGSLEAKLLQQAIEGNLIAARSAAFLAQIANQPAPGNAP